MGRDETTTKRIKRGYNLDPAEDRMLQAIVELLYPARPENKRSEASGIIFRAVFDLLVKHGRLPAPAEEIRPEDYEGWARRLGLEV